MNNPEDIVVAPVPVAALLPDRLRHWQGLPGQEYFVEQHAQAGRACRLFVDSECVGYLILSDGGVLVELHIEHRAGITRSAVAAHVLRKLGIGRVWCLSFNVATMELCREFCEEPAEIGIACRVYRRRPRLPQPFGVRAARPADLPAILAINEPDILASPEEAAAYVAAGWLLLFEQGPDLTGFGVMTPIMSGRPEVDIGMLVAPPFRGNGYGAAFIQFLAEHVLGQGRVPVCGCDIDNHASRRSLENAGFATEHRLLEFRVRGG